MQLFIHLVREQGKCSSNFIAYGACVRSEFVVLISLQFESPYFTEECSADHQHLSRLRSS